MPSFFNSSQHRVITWSTCCGDSLLTISLRDWSLMTGKGGGYKMGGGGGSEVLPLRKGGMEKVSQNVLG